MFRLSYSVFASGRPGPAAKRAHARRGGGGLLQGINLPRLLMVGVAGALIVVSASFSVRFAQSVGEPSGNGWIFILMALAVEGYAAFAIPAFWRGLNLPGRAGLLAFLLLCLVYKVTAADHFAAENYGKREASQGEMAARFERAKREVGDLRAVLEENADARAAGVIEAEIKAAKQHARWASTDGCTNATVPPSREFCDGFYRLEAELVMANKAAEAQQKLTKAIGRLENMDPVAVHSTGDRGIVLQLLEWAGIAVGGFTAFISKLCMLLVEGGSVAVPAMAGLARRQRVEPEAASVVPSPQPGSPEPEIVSPKVSAPGRSLTAKERAAIDELTEFLASRTERHAGETVQSSRLYAAYVAWKEGQKGKALPIQMVGTVLTHQLGLTKSKIDGRHYYHNLRIVTAEAGRKASGDLQLVSASRK